MSRHLPQNIPPWFQQANRDLLMYYPDDTEVKYDYDQGIHFMRMACHIHAHYHSQDPLLAELPIVAFNEQDAQYLVFFHTAFSLYSEEGRRTWPHGLAVSAVRIALTEEPWIWSFDPDVSLSSSLFPYTPPELLLSARLRGLTLNLSKTPYPPDLPKHPSKLSSKPKNCSLRACTNGPNSRVTQINGIDVDSVSIPEGCWKGSQNFARDRCLYDPREETRLFQKHSSEDTLLATNNEERLLFLRAGFRALVRAPLIVAPLASDFSKPLYPVPIWFQQEENIRKFYLYCTTFSSEISLPCGRVGVSPVHSAHICRLACYVEEHLMCSDRDLGCLPLVVFSREDVQIIRFLALLCAHHYFIPDVSSPRYLSLSQITFVEGESNAYFCCREGIQSHFPYTVTELMNGHPECAYWWDNWNRDFPISQTPYNPITEKTKFQRFIGEKATFTETDRYNLCVPWRAHVRLPTRIILLFDELCEGE